MLTQSSGGVDVKLWFSDLSKGGSQLLPETSSDQSLFGTGFRSTCPSGKEFILGPIVTRFSRLRESQRFFHYCSIYSSLVLSS